MARTKKTTILDKEIDTSFDTAAFRLFKGCVDFANIDLDPIFNAVSHGRTLAFDFRTKNEYNESAPIKELDPLPIDPMTALIIGIPPIFTDQIDAHDIDNSIRRLNGYRWVIYQEKLYRLMGVRSIADIRRKYSAYTGDALHKAMKRQIEKWNDCPDCKLSDAVASILLGISDTSLPSRDPLEVLPRYPFNDYEALSLDGTPQERVTEAIDEEKKHLKAVYDEKMHDLRLKELDLERKEAELELRNNANFTMREYQNTIRIQNETIAQLKEQLRYRC